MGPSGALLRAVLALCLAVGLTTAFTCTPHHFAEFRAHYNRHYATPEEAAHRYAVFCDNMAHADQLNQRHPTARFGSTKFADLTTDEFRRDYLGLRLPTNLTLLPPAQAPASLLATPTACDWRNFSRDVVTPVKNQGQCGSCWAFSATELIETAWALAGNQLVELSPQQIVDCDNPAQHGCVGGWPYDAINYVIETGGLELAVDYPYTGMVGQCQWNPGYVGAKVGGWTNAGAGQENMMAAWLASTGPLAVIVDSTSWQTYQGGILPAASCGTSLDHAVVAVGYDMQVGYWAIRNSWGADWGEAGYIYIQFGENACGVSTYPIVASG